ncbi:MAG: hypothetical protein U1E76_06840 [Planctomycetota bacterium]
MSPWTTICAYRRAAFGMMGLAILFAVAAPARSGDRDFLARQLLTASDGISRDEFGDRVAIDGDVAVIGAPSAAYSAGACYVFRREHGSWQERQKLLPSGPGTRQQFGRSVAIDGDAIVVGAPSDDEACPGHDDCDAGAAYVYRLDPSIDAWQLEAKLMALDGQAAAAYGMSVAVHDDAIAVGAPSYGLYDASGAVYVHRRSGSGWSQEARIQPPDLGADDRFGNAVGLDQDLLLIGAPQFGGNGQGHARVYRHSGSNWVEEQQLVIAGTGDHLGTAVALLGVRAFLGAPDDDVPGLFSGSVSIFERSRVTGTWNLTQKLLPSDGGGGFGESLSVDDDVLVIGASRRADEQGAAYVFREQSGTWHETQQLVAGSPRDFDEFGCSVAVSGAQLLVGAYGRDDLADDAGAVSAYLSGPPGGPLTARLIQPHALKQGPRVWYVGGPDDDFLDVQSAVDAASIGDAIFVKPIKTFEVFSLTKGVSVRSTSGRFKIKRSPSSDVVAISGIPADEVACVSGIEDESYGGSVHLRIEQCAGRVILENVWLGDDRPVTSAIAIDGCAFVELTDVLAHGGVAMQDQNDPAVSIIDSQVVMSHAQIHGPWTAGFEWGTGDGCPGASGLSVVRSKVFAARSVMVGGTGGDGDTSFYHPYPPHGGVGGAGILLDAAELLLAGCCGDEQVLGGQGGDAGWDSDFRTGAGGDGGPGVSGMSAVVSHVDLLGGVGGFGYPNGDAGPPYEGDVGFVNPPYPTLDVTDQFRIGESFQLTLRGQPGWSAVLLVSSRQGWIDPPWGQGPPLVAIPGEFFNTIYLGIIDDSGALQASVAIDGDPDSRGSPLTVQAVVTDPLDGASVFSSAATRTIGE